MSAKTKTRKSTARPGFIREGWRARVHPAFANYWLALKKNRALPSVKDPKQTERQFESWFREFALASRAYEEAREQLKNPIGPKIQSEILKGLDTEGPPVIPPALPAQNATFYPQSPESSAIFRKLVFLKYGITFRELIHQLDIDKDPAAHRKLMAIHRDYWQVHLGRGFRDLKLKFSMDHFDLITQGLDFGLDRLNPDELAQCLDEICPCALRHSPEYLKKLRAQVKKACATLLKTRMI